MRPPAQHHALRAALAFALAFAAVACSGLKEGAETDEASASLPGPTTSASTAAPGLPLAPDGGTTVTAPPSTTGAGPYGALPNGYCCSADTDCRNRTCTGGMCIDRCSDDDGCLDMAGPFTCQGGLHEKQCVPAATAKCVPATDFRRGTKKLGECCTATHDARAGLECEGGRCEAFGPSSNPYICGQACEKSSDCPGAFMCLRGPYDFKISVPESTDAYTCK